MTPIEELLRATLAETPTVIPTSDPLGALDGRIRTARRRVAFGATLAGAAVAAAVVVPVTQLGSEGKGAGKVIVGTTPSDTPTPTPSGLAQQTDVWAAGHGVATNDGRGHSFVVTEFGNGATRSLAELGPNGTVLHRYTLPESALFVSQREGTAWVWGGGDGAFPISQVTAVEIPGGTPQSFAFPRGEQVVDLAITEGGQAWAVGVDKVVQLTVSGGAVHITATVPMAGARRIVVTSAGHLWVQADTRLVELVPTGGPGSSGARQGVSVHWAGALFAASSQGDLLWVENNTRQIALLDPVAESQGSSGALAGGVLDLPRRPALVAPDGAGGIFVAFTGGGAAYYDAAALKADGPPTAQLSPDAVEVETMALTLDGGLLMQDYGGTVLHWRPTAP
jgi:hypothetical protein